MNIKRLAGIVFLILVLIMGCSGNQAHLKTQSAIESKATQQKLINHWSDYNIRYCAFVIVFDPKKNDKKIIVGNWYMVKDQETWTQLVNGTKKMSSGHINQVWGNEIREIWSPDNRFYGYITHHPNEVINVQVVDENTVQLLHKSSLDRRVY